MSSITSECLYPNFTLDDDILRNRQSLLLQMCMCVCVQLCKIRSWVQNRRSSANQVKEFPPLMFDRVSRTIYKHLQH